MREILFRGKRYDTGEWVCGSFLGDIYGAHEFPAILENPEYDDGNNIAFDYHFVCPQTVGQYTGFVDGNGRKIFEGDIVGFTRVNALGYTNRRIGEVKYYDKLPIFYILATTGDAWDWVECNNITVIGNVHDNPDLLEGSTNGL